jgi:hypothetical protein
MRATKNRPAIDSLDMPGIEDKSAKRNENAIEVSVHVYENVFMRSWLITLVISVLSCYTLLVGYNFSH